MDDRLPLNKLPERGYLEDPEEALPLLYRDETMVYAPMDEYQSNILEHLWFWDLNEMAVFEIVHRYTEGGSRWGVPRVMRESEFGHYYDIWSDGFVDGTQAYQGREIQVQRLIYRTNGEIQWFNEPPINQPEPEDDYGGDVWIWEPYKTEPVEE